jgi:hypothetical protein
MLFPILGDSAKMYMYYLTKILYQCYCRLATYAPAARSRLKHMTFS